MENLTLRIVYLAVLMWLGWSFSPDKHVVAMRRSIFDFHAWSIWLGVFPAILIHMVGICAGVMSQNRPWVWLIYIGIEAAILVVLLILYPISTRKPYAVLGVSFQQLPRQMVMGLRWIVGYFILGNTFLFLISFIFVKLLNLPAILEYVLVRQRQTMRGGGALLGLIETEFGAGKLWMPMIFLVVIGPLLEELVFRGFLYGPIRRRAGSTIAIFLTALLFMLGHGHISQTTFVFGLFFAYLYESTQSLMPGFFFHALLNFRIVQFYLERNEPLDPAHVGSEFGWRVLFLLLIFLGILIIHRKIRKKGTFIPLPELMEGQEK
ncbi:MAG: lysostaphin resistance A-like protein [Nitrospiria bacterium]